MGLPVFINVAYFFTILKRLCGKGEKLGTKSSEGKGAGHNLELFMEQVHQN